MMQEKLEAIFNQFNHENDFDSYKELASGHINDTFLIIAKQKPFYVLQRINQNVFNDIPGLVQNKTQISQHLRSKLSHLNKEELSKRVLTFVKAKDEKTYFQDKDYNYWNLMVFIEGSQTFEIVEKDQIAYEAGKLIGNFLHLTSDFDTSKLIEVIPNFHSMSFRYQQFEAALTKASKERKDIVKKYISLVQQSKEEMQLLENLQKSGKIRIRVTHNDTKISNTLFAKDNKGLCVIDTDTVMPGIVHFDFGDAIRTICNTAAEDEKNLDLVNFNKAYYEAYKKGFLEEIGDSLTESEIAYLPLGAKTIMFIMALRFLTDYLNNNIYFKTRYNEHNLDRAKNQFKLMEMFTEKINTSFIKE